MIAYRSALSGSGNEYEYTVKSISNGVETIHPGTCQYMFANTLFNEPVTIGNNVTDYAYMFYNCKNFDQPISIPSIVTNTTNMFAETKFSGAGSSFNFDNVKNTSRMFYNSLFNAPITFPNVFVNNISSMFENCHALNAPIVLPRYTSAPDVLRNCSNFNQDIELSAFKNANNLLCDCSNFGSDIYFKIKDVSPAYFTLGGILQNTNYQARKNIYMNREIFNYWALMDQIIYHYENGGYVEWSSMTNGYYNTAYNVYVYTNYNG